MQDLPFLVRNSVAEIHALSNQAVKRTFNKGQLCLAVHAARLMCSPMAPCASRTALAGDVALGAHTWPPTFGAPTRMPCGAPLRQHPPNAALGATSYSPAHVYIVYTGEAKLLCTAEPEPSHGTASGKHGDDADDGAVQLGGGYRTVEPRRTGVSPKRTRTLLRRHTPLARSPDHPCT
eukprot:3710848-Prymnesium_polylepis.1